MHQRVAQSKTPGTNRQKNAGASIARPAVQRWLQPGMVAPKLAISTPTDIDEQEADRVADHVMRMPGPAVQRACASCTGGGAPCPKCQDEKTEPVQRKSQTAGETAGASVPADFVQGLGPGRPLDHSTRAFFEPRFARDFSHVLVHTEPRAAESAQAIHAQAYTVGRHIAFADGNYAPHTIQGNRLLAHELTHVVQQSGGAGVVQRRTEETETQTHPFSVTTAAC